MSECLFTTYNYRREWIKALTVTLVGVLLFVVPLLFCRIVISETDSLPEHYFIHLPYLKAGKGDYVISYSDWYKGRIIKKIIGIGGDKVWYDKAGYLFVNHIRIGLPKLSSTDGRPLTPIAAQVIPQNYVFLYSPHESSFDSRYEELGLVPQSAFRGRVVGLK